MIVATVGEELGLLGVLALNRRLRRGRPCGYRIALGARTSICGSLPRASPRRGGAGGDQLRRRARPATRNRRSAALRLLRGSSLIVFLAAAGILVNIGRRSAATRRRSPRVQRRRLRRRRGWSSPPVGPAHVMPALAWRRRCAARAEVSFVGVRGRPPRSWSRPGYREDLLRLRGLERRRRRGTSERGPCPGGAAARRVAARPAPAPTWWWAPRPTRAGRSRLAAWLTGGAAPDGGATRTSAWPTRLPRRSRSGWRSPSAAGPAGHRYMVTGRPVGRAVLRATRTAAAGIRIQPTPPWCWSPWQPGRPQPQPRCGRGPSATRLLRAHPRRGARGWRRSRPPRRARPGPRYRLFDYLANFPEAVAAADLVVSRAGGSVFEITAIGRPRSSCPTPRDRATTRPRTRLAGPRGPPP